MPRELVGNMDAKGLRLAVVVSRFNQEITQKLLAGAVKAIRQAGGDVENLPVAHVPGSLELAIVARKFAESGRYDAVICLGAVVRGETAHYDCVVQGTTQSVMSVSAQTGVPVIFGVLTCETWEQAMDRVDENRRGHTGVYAARAAIEMTNLIKQVESLKSQVKSRKGRRR